MMFLPVLGLTSTSSGRETLVNRACELSKKGIDNTNQAEAIDILLRLSTSNYEGSKVTGVRGSYLAFLIVALGVVLAGFRVPTVSFLALGVAVAH